MAVIEQADIDAIEQAIDKLGLAKVLDMVATVCYEKAQHLEENWQDATTAKAWVKAGHAVDAASMKREVLAVTY